MSLAPALFISHGSPMFAIEPGLLGPRLLALAGRLDSMRAIVVVSPHWQTQGSIGITASVSPETIHDFGGFPASLYGLQYRPPGDPALAADVLCLLAGFGLPASLDHKRGLDHGVWVPLRYLRPAADVPVLQVSMPRDLDTHGALQLGRALAPLRERGVLVIGSGSLTHNLYEFRQHIRDPEYAQAFAGWIREAVLRGDVDALLDYRRQAPHAERAHPTEEHFLPLLIALGATAAEETCTLIEGGMTHQVLSMDSFGFGLPPQMLSAAAVNTARRSADSVFH